MKNNIFRTQDFWKTAVMTMPDNSFFELMRSVFGKIKTPFNKQQLLNDLESFLLRKDIQETIAAYIDETDAKIITATALFTEPLQDQLVDFFKDEINYSQLLDIIVNLEERFIIYRFTEKSKTFLALNPVLQNILLPFTEDTCSLFPAVSQDITSKYEVKKKNCLNDLITAAFYSFVFRHESFYKSEGVMRKRVLDDAKTIFPDIDVEPLLGALQILGLFYTDEDKLLPDKKRFDDFSLLAAHERSEYICAALIIFSSLSPPYEILPPLFYAKIRELLIIIHNFLESLNEETQYTEKTLKRMMELYKTQSDSRIYTEMFIESMEKTGLLQNKGNIFYKQKKSNTEKKTTPSITIDSGTSILVYPEIEFNDAVKLASVSNISETSAVVRFDMDKESAVRSFNNNISADEIIELLNRLSNGGADNGLIWNLKDWEKRHNEVSLKKGVILQLTEERRYLTETKFLSRLIIETLAPGIYLLNENDMAKAADALQSAGIDIIGQQKERKNTPVSSLNYFPSLSSSISQKKAISLTNIGAENNASVSQSENSNRLEEKKQTFYSLLEKTNLSESEKKELCARIDRRLILCETQLKDAGIRYEKLEARRMDYTGKQNIAKQAITLKSPVEVVWTNKGEESRIFGIPRILEKDGNNLILLINEFRIPLAKIGLLRRIKKSIFEV